MNLDVANRIAALAVDCLDAEKLADFWCQVLDWQVVERDEYGVSIAAAGGPFTIDFLTVPDGPKTSKNRLHLDVRATDRDQEAELQRLLSLGATPADIGQGEIDTDDVTWHVLADPEGNEFCLLRGRSDPQPERQ
jgi:catechol-2,3-dioxygenase